MNYYDGETLILERIRSLSNFGVDNSAQSNWRILATGASDHYAILRPRSFTIEGLTLASFLVIYETIIEIWQKYTSASEAVTELSYNVYKLFELLAYPNLGQSANILNGVIVSGEEPETMSPVNSSGVDWLRQRVLLVWQVENLVTYQE